MECPVENQLARLDFGTSNGLSSKIEMRIETRLLQTGQSPRAGVRPRRETSSAAEFQIIGIMSIPSAGF